MQATPEARLQQALTQWSDWPVSARPRVIRQFDQGENHDCFLLQCGAEPLVLKLFRTPQRHAVRCQQWAAEQGLAPEILFASATGSYALMHYCETTAAPEPALLAHGLRRLHAQDANQIGVVTGRFDLFSFCEKYLALAGPEAAQLHISLEPAFTPWLDDTTPDSLCHNDLVQENCLVREQLAQFIDWEYAQLNNPWFDVASIMYYHSWVEVGMEAFMEHYKPEWQAQLSQPVFASASCAFLWTDILWHLARSGPQSWPQQTAKLADLKRFAATLEIYF